MALLLDYLKQRYPLAKTQTLRRMIGQGRVRINGARATGLKQPVESSDAIECREEKPVDPRRLARQANSRRIRQITAPTPGEARFPFAVIHEDADLIVINKPAGLLTATNEREKRTTALALLQRDALLRDPGTIIGLVHRLDKDASGLLVFSKHPDAFTSLKRQFFDHTVDRVYSAIVHGTPNPTAGRIESRLLELPDGRVVTTRLNYKGQLAVTDYAFERKLAGGLSLLRVTLQTGRKHQIRSHLSQRNWPIAGDRMYGRTPPAPDELLMLCAVHLAFTHPRTEERCLFEIPLPPPMAKLAGAPA